MKLQALAITKRELKSMFREKSFALMLVLELMLVSASGFMSLGYVIFTSPESSGMLNQLSSLIYVGVVTENIDEFTQSLERQGVNYRFYSTFAAGKKDFKDGRVDALIHGDIDYGENPSMLTIYLPSNSPKRYLTMVSVKKALVDLEKQVRAVKVGMHVPDFKMISYKIIHFDPNARYIEVYYVFTIPLILFLPALVAGSLSIDSITQEFEDKSIINLLMAPISDKMILYGKTLAAVVISVLQSVLWLFILDVTSVDIANKTVLVIVCTLYSILFVNIGSIVSLLVREMRGSQIVYTLFSISAISLFSPVASLNDTLLANSPAYLLSQLALGFPVFSNLSAIIFLAIVSAASTILSFALSPRIEHP